MGDITNNISPPPMPNMNSQAASLMSAKIMVIGIIVLFFVLAFCFILSIYAKWYWSRNEDPTVVAWRRNALRSGAQQQTGARKRGGLDRATLRSIPMLMYDTKDFKEGLECSVCLSEITQGEKVRLLPKCNHGFHVECIDMWFKSHSTCPLCRNSIVSLSRDEESRATPAHAGVVRDSSDSDSNSDSDSEQHENGSHAAGETISIPTNVLFFGNEVQVRSRGETANEDSATSTSASASTSGVNNQRDELVIEIPRDLCDDCSSSPPPRAEIVEEGSSKTPVVSRLRSLKRLLSRGRMMPSWASGSSSIDIESMENKS